MDSTQPLYQRLASHYRHAILQGALTPGERVPSVRTLMRVHRVSLSTALQACRELETEGLLEARPRSGYFVRTAVRPALPPPREPDCVIDAAQYVGVHHRISEYVARRAASDVRVDLSVAVAASHCYPLDELRRAMGRALRNEAQWMVRGAPGQGHPALRAALARRAYSQGMTPSADDVIITHGCTEALNVALRTVTSPGDTVAVESPTYFGLLQILESLGLRALEIPVSPQTGMSVEALDLALQTQPGIRAVVAVPNLHNPLGSIMPDAEKARLVALCEARGVPLIEDDSYGLLADDDVPLRALKSWDRSGNVMYCASLHKTLAPGMRLGWMSAGRWHRRAAMLKFTMSRANEGLAQAAVADVLEARVYDRHLHALRLTLRRDRSRLAAAVAQHFPPGTRACVPSGSMLLWVELPAGCSSWRVFETALRAGIAITPGTLFSNTGRFEHYMRISCGEGYSPRVEEALRRLGAIVAEASPRATA
ncbi:PLP-dependent aminotransferase family protein [Verticiella sediminum]|uniref:PLP-dependent aminotransferase family protein n=1 Tax=Verticiella sediminum TaxID=1247510 RepID=A0A556AGZ8_9BURK|nr:PLP-dependent aminotransferase family protein [Verticiella sediminum]TSH92149.1 PLP-dependent aminotransferase family protein [Verticiella sediminum]